MMICLLSFCSFACYKMNSLCFLQAPQSNHLCMSPLLVQNVFPKCPFCKYQLELQYASEWRWMLGRRGGVSTMTVQGYSEKVANRFGVLNKNICVHLWNCLHGTNSRSRTKGGRWWKARMQLHFSGNQQLSRSIYIYTCHYLYYIYDQEDNRHQVNTYCTLALNPFHPVPVIVSQCNNINKMVFYAF